jgi:hypothetical protein
MGREIAGLVDEAKTRVNANVIQPVNQFTKRLFRIDEDPNKKQPPVGCNAIQKIFPTSGYHKG